MSAMVDTVPDFEQYAARLVELGQRIHARGWVPATSGNFSCRLDNNEIAITVSGRDKGYLQPADIMRVSAEGESLDGKKPSAETLLHTQLYQWNEQIGCVLHTHSLSATVLSQTGTLVELRDWELFKAFAGFNTHAHCVRIPVVANDQNIQRLCQAVTPHLHDEMLPAYLIRGHGLYTWGETPDDAWRHLEALEFLFQCELERRKVNPL